MVDELAAEIAAAHPLQPSYPLDDFYGLSPALADLGRRLSRHTAVAYVETDYIGGVGTQAAVVWERGVITLGPLMSDGRGAVNYALRRLGVQRGDAHDEFEALGLVQCRITAEWVKRMGTSP